MESSKITHIDYKDELVSILSYFISLCEKYDLNYYCIGGTLIGAIRHHGMIPWDDDIDVIMPRPDYDRLLEILASEKNESFDYISPQNNSSYYLPFSKICKKNSSLLEFKNIPCLLGIYIDIFPLDGTSDDIDERKELFFKYRRIANNLMIVTKKPSINFKDSFKRLKNLHLRTWMNEFKFMFFKKHKRNQLLLSCEAIEKKYDYKRASYLANYGGMWGIKETFRKEWFEGFVLMPFDGLTVRVPSGYDAILKQMYGDYLTPPPVEKRVSRHNIAYLNLTERVNIDTVYEILNNEK